MAHKVALWTITVNARRDMTVPLLERMCNFIPKGDKLSELLRKIADKSDPLLGGARTLILKKSISN